MKPVPKWSPQRGASFICRTWNLHNSTWLRPFSMKPVPDWSAQRGASFICRTWNLHNSTRLRPFSMKPVPDWLAQRGASFMCKTWNLHSSKWLRPISMKPVPKWSPQRGAYFICKFQITNRSELGPFHAQRCTTKHLGQAECAERLNKQKKNGRAVHDFVGWSPVVFCFFIKSTKPVPKRKLFWTKTNPALILAWILLFALNYINRYTLSRFKLNKLGHVWPSARFLSYNFHWDICKWKILGHWRMPLW